MRIVAARREAPFESVAEVAIRADLRDDEVQVLAHAGAFARFGLTRREAMWQAAGVPKGALLRFREARRAGYAGTEKGASQRPDDVPRQDLLSQPAGVAAGNAAGTGVFRPHEDPAEGGTVRVEQPDATRGDLRAGEYRGRIRARPAGQLCPAFEDRPRLVERTRNAYSSKSKSELVRAIDYDSVAYAHGNRGQDVAIIDSIFTAS